MNPKPRLNAGKASAYSSSDDIWGRRFFIENVYPAVDGGAFAVKRIVGEPIDVWADIIRDGHDVLAAALRWRRHDDKSWHMVRMKEHGNDRWTASFTPPAPGRYLYAIEAWTDTFGTWRRDYLVKRAAGLDVALEAAEGCTIFARMRTHTISPLIAQTAQQLEGLSELDRRRPGAVDALLADELATELWAAEPRTDLTWSPLFPLIVDRPKARASAWYEIFPRSQSPVAGRHGTFDDCIARLPDIAALGFDVLYLTPIHPIGQANRKGRNNALKAEPGDPGSPYAIGSADGGHDAVHPELGTLADFRRLVAACRDHGMEIALDFAIQCSPDHPWLKQHPEWFSWRPDGSLRYAENPPKKYEDIVVPDFYCTDRSKLWSALRDVVLFWIEQGVRIFRVDNPHTKPLPFWQWLIREVQSRDPDVIFLSEAFTRPKMMKALAKLGFTQSYTYFTWRTSKAELSEYVAELTGYPERDYFRPNFFVNTPDILPFHLQTGAPWMFKSRLALAATLSSSYGVYNGYELLEHEPIAGREEYRDSEKYELKHRNWHAPGNLRAYITQLNRLRRENPALLQTQNLRFAAIDNDQVLGFVKEASTFDNAVAVAVALAPEPREFWFHFGDLRIGPSDARHTVKSIENLITGERHRLEWGGVRLRIDPAHDPALLFRCSA
jgi:starch synthase (maltosyl-transferring)